MQVMHQGNYRDLFTRKNKLQALAFSHFISRLDKRKSGQRQCSELDKIIVNLIKGSYLARGGACAERRGYGPPPKDGQVE